MFFKINIILFDDHNFNILNGSLFIRVEIDAKITIGYFSVRNVPSKRRIGKS